MKTLPKHTRKLVCQMRLLTEELQGAGGRVLMRCYSGVVILPGEQVQVILNPMERRSWIRYAGNPSRFFIARCRESRRSSYRRWAPGAQRPISSKTKEVCIKLGRRYRSNYRQPFVFTSYAGPCNRSLNRTIHGNRLSCHSPLPLHQ